MSPSKTRPGVRVAQARQRAELSQGQRAIAGSQDENAVAKAQLGIVRVGLQDLCEIFATGARPAVLDHQRSDPARPIDYKKRENVESSFASRTMIWSGVLVAVFIVYHIMNLTLGAVGLPFEEGIVPNRFVGRTFIMPDQPARDRAVSMKLNIIAELVNVKDRDTIVGKVTFDEHGQNTVPIITKYVVQDGKWVLWEDSEYASGKRKLRGK